MKIKQLFSSEPIYLVDGSAFIFRGFYANNSLARSDGFKTGAIFLTIRVLIKLLKDENAKRIALVIDGKPPNFRHEIFPAYKSQRKSTPDDLIAQIDPIKRIASAMGIPVIVSEGCEADDCIASIAYRERENGAAIIISGDKDLKQCLHKNVVMWDPSVKNAKLVTLADFEVETGLTPSQWPDVQAIIGDSSDNIPGIPGIGIKTAEKIFKQFKTLEEIRDNLSKLPSGIAKKFEGHLDAMFLYRQLSTLKIDECMDLTPDDLCLTPPDCTELLALQREFELFSFARDFETLFKGFKQKSTDGHHVDEKSQSLLMDDNDETNDAEDKSINKNSDTPSTNIITAQSIDILPPDYECAKKHFIAVVNCEKLLRVALDETEYIINFPVEDIIALLSRAVAMSSSTSIVVPDLKLLIHSNVKWNSIPECRFFDLSIASYLLDPEQQDYSWHRLYGHWSALLGIRENCHGIVALKIAGMLENQIKAANLSRLIREIELPLAPILAKMEMRGIVLDTSKLANFLSSVQDELDSLTKRIYEEAGGEFNIRSAQQRGEVLFKKLKLPINGKTEGGQASTSKDALENLSGFHPVVDTLLRYRLLEKLRSTYLEPLPRLIGKDGRIRTTLNQCATATGRLSSSNPNLQNIPVRGDEGKRMRYCFTAKDGFEMLSSDYSQIELRVLAHLSGDSELIAAFKNNEDIHARTASILYGISIDDVTKNQRGFAKTINFGLVYGMGARKLAKNLKISVSDAKIFIDRYFEKLSRLKLFYEEIKENAHRDGYVTTITGRRRILPWINGEMREVATAERQAVNTVIQGSAADIIKMAMIAVDKDRLLNDIGAKLLLQIHDELLLEVPSEHAKEAGDRVSYLMQNVIKLSVPLIAEWGVGKSWGDAH